MNIISQIQHRRDTTANWELNNPILNEGELGIEFRTNGSTGVKIGDGTSTWNDLVYISADGITVETQEAIDDIAGEGRTIETVKGLSDIVSNHLDDIAKVFKLATELGMVDNDETKAVANYEIINTFLNGGENRVIFLNGGKFWISEKLRLTLPHTSILGNNRGKNLDVSCIAGNFADTVIEVAIISGDIGSYIQNIAIDGNDVATMGLDTGNNNFHDNLFDGIYIDNINGVGFHVGENNYSSIYYRIFTGSECSVGLQLESEANQQSSFRDCKFLGITYGGIIGTDDNVKEELRCIDFSGCLFNSPGTPLKFNKCSYGIEFQRTWVEKSTSGILSDYLIILGSIDTKASGITFTDTHFQSNALTNYTFHWKNADAINFMGNVKINNSVNGFIDATGAITVNSNSIFLATGAPNPTTVVNGLKISQLFKLYLGDSVVTDPQFKTSVYIDLDAQTAASPNGVLIRSRRKSETQDRVSLKESGLYFGDGSIAADTRFARKSAGVGGMGTGQHFQLDGTWDGGHFLMGNYHMWIDGTGKPRLKNGAPTSDTDGVIFSAIV